jgi:hypothetical protein
MRDVDFENPTLQFLFHKDSESKITRHLSCERKFIVQLRLSGSWIWKNTDVERKIWKNRGRQMSYDICYTMDEKNVSD